MEHRIIKNCLCIVLFFTILALSSCYNDNYETLYPASACDTTNITFSNDVFPIIKTSCLSCHNEKFAGGNVLLTNYREVIDAIKKRKLMESIRHDPGYPPMPKGGNKLSPCDIAKITKWLKEGAPDN